MCLNGRQNPIMAILLLPAFAASDVKTSRKAPLLLQRAKRFADYCVEFSILSRYFTPRSSVFCYPVGTAYDYTRANFSALLGTGKNF